MKQFIDANLISIINNNNNTNKTIYLKDRISTIQPEFIGYKLAIFNGKEYKTFGRITLNHVGKKLGEFSPTKKPAIYKKGKKK